MKATIKRLISITAVAALLTGVTVGISFATDATQYIKNNPVSCNTSTCDFSNQTIGSAAAKIFAVNVDYSNANFTGATLNNIDFSGTAFSGAKFNRAIITNCKFTGSMGSSDFRGATLTSNDFTGAKMGQVKWINDKLSTNRALGAGNSINPLPALTIP